MVLLISYGFILFVFVVATVIALAIWRIALQVIIRPVIIMTSFRRRKYVFCPSRERIIIAEKIGAALLMIFFIEVSVAYFIGRFPADILDGVAYILPAAIMAAILFVLFEEITSISDVVVERLIRKNEDKLLAEYLRQKEWKDSGKEIMPTDYRIGNKTYRI